MYSLALHPVAGNVSSFSTASLWQKETSCCLKAIVPFFQFENPLDNYSVHTEKEVNLQMNIHHASPFFADMTPRPTFEPAIDWQDLFRGTPVTGTAILLYY